MVARKHFYESGNMGEARILELFSHLIKTGTAWTLQGHYSRTAKHLINNNFINKNGKILIGVGKTEKGPK